MGDRIGEYIHFKYDNYLTYGLGHASSATGRFTGIPNKPDISKIFEEQRKKIKDKAQKIIQSQTMNKAATKKEIEDIFNFFWPQPNQTTSFTQLANRFGITTDELRRQIIQTIKDVKFNKFNFDFTDNLGVENLQRKLPEFKRMTQLASNGGSQQRIQWKAIDTKIGLLKQAIDKYSKDEDLEQWRIDARSIIKEWEDFKKEVITITKKGKEKKNIELARIKFFEKDENGKNFIDRLNEVILGVQSYSKSFLLGQIAELIPVAEGVCIKAKATITLDELLSDIGNAVNNSNNQNLSIRQTGWDSSVALKRKKDYVVQGVQGALQQLSFEGSENYLQYLGSTKLSMLGTQDKVDVEITMQDGRQINTSIKNYNIPNNTFLDIHLLSGTDPAKYLSNYKLFLNHYLNIVPWRTFPSGFPRESIEKLQSFSAPYLNSIIDANKTLNFSLSLIAITGGILKSQKIDNILQAPTPQAMAPFFVVNDNSGVTGHYKVYFVDDYIELLYSHYNELERFLKSSIKNTYRFQTIYETKHETPYSNAYSRILQLLIKFESLKLDLSVPKSVLNTWYNMTP